MSRDIRDLTPETQRLYYAWADGMKRAGIEYVITCTKRTPEEQLELWKKGRVFRDGKWLVVDKKKCVTWTLHSNHFTGEAFDFAIVVNGKIVWNPGLDADADGIPEYSEAGIIGEKVGLRWGGRFKGVDAAHLELMKAPK
jgi:peptidoglycan LD-endopeptidase CwlK